MINKKKQMVEGSMTNKGEQKIWSVIHTHTHTHARIQEHTSLIKTVALPSNGGKCLLQFVIILVVAHFHAFGRIVFTLYRQKNAERKSEDSK